MAGSTVAGRMHTQYRGVRGVNDAPAGDRGQRHRQGFVYRHGQHGIDEKHQQQKDDID